MTIKLVIILVLLWNLLTVCAAVMINIYNGANHFREGGFITILSVIQLLAISFLSFKIFLARDVTRVRSLLKKPSILWAIIGLGFLFLAADEYFLIHENIDRLTHHVFNLQETGLTDRIDDILVGLYGLAGIGVLIAYREELKMYRETFKFFIIGFVLLFTMVALDILTNREDILSLIIDHHQVALVHHFLSRTEESLKVFSEAFFVIAFYGISQKAKPSEEEAVVSTIG
ncbi:MAG: hypothetical protein ACN4GR_12265 [Arenicellales bacterium]